MNCGGNTTSYFNGKSHNKKALKVGDTYKFTLNFKIHKQYFYFNQFYFFFQTINFYYYQTQ